MKYLILSDIHGSMPRLKRALAIFEERHCDMILILGDILNYGPRNTIPEGIDPKGIVEALNAHAHHIIAVRGNCDAEVDQMLLHFPIMQTYTLIVDEGKTLFLTHGHIYNPDNLPPGHFDYIFYGHTHIKQLYTNNQGTTICNTGSITFPKAGNPPTLAIYEHGQVELIELF